MGLADTLIAKIIAVFTDDISWNPPDELKDEGLWYGADKVQKDRYLR